MRTTASSTHLRQGQRYVYIIYMAPREKWTNNLRKSVSARLFPAASSRKTVRGASSMHTLAILTTPEVGEREKNKYMRDLRRVPEKACIVVAIYYSSSVHWNRNDFGLYENRLLSYELERNGTNIVKNLSRNNGGTVLQYCAYEPLP